jgi:hypothetical protein
MQVVVHSGWRFWVNLDNIIPKPFQFKTYAYMRPLGNGKYFEPNGIFFLEPSMLSQFVALALIIEFRIFRRWRNIIVLAATLLASFAGTGLVMVAVVAPFMLPKISMRGIMATSLGGAAVVTLLVVTGFISHLASRLGELGEHGRSGNERFIQPLQKLADTMQNPDFLFHGTGAGSIPIGNGQIWWPITKDVVEYGLVMALAFYIFLAWSVLRGARDIAIALAMMMSFSFLGGAPPIVGCVLLFCAMLRVKGPQPIRTASSIAA